MYKKTNKKGNKEYNMENAKQKKFKELAEIRVNRVINDLKLVGNLGNKSRYESSNEDRKKIINTIKNSVKEMESNLNNATKDKEKWTL